MKNSLLIPIKILLLIAVFNFILLIFGAWLKITHISFGIVTPNSVLTIGIVSSFIVWIIVLIDIFKSQTKNLLWIIGMFLFASITPIFYLINKK